MKKLRALIVDDSSVMRKIVEASCSVYGMPRSCAESGVLQRVVPLMQIPDQITQATNQRRPV